MRMNVCQMETVPPAIEAHFVTPLEKPEVWYVCEQFKFNSLYVTETDSWNSIPRACQNAMRKFRCVRARVFQCVSAVVQLA
jgi:hypothetical protein